MSEYLEYANKLAMTNVDEGGQPFGACIVYKGEIIAEGANETHIKNDVTRHAELIAIEKAQKHLNTMDLSECVLYASGHPCPMCLGAIGFANLKEVYYNNTLKEAKEASLGLSLDIYHFIKDEPTDLELKLVHTKTETDPMTYYSNKGKR